MPSAPVSRFPSDEVVALEQNLHELLRAYAENPGETSVQAGLDALRRRLAAAVAVAPKETGREAVLATVRPWLKRWAESGSGDRPVAAADLAAADAYVARDWRGLLAAMLLVPAWQWPAAPRLGDVPAWTWADFTRYVFYPVQGFCLAGDAQRHAAHHLRRLEELTALVGAGRHGPETAAAVGAYLNHSSCIPLYFSEGSLRRHYELRGRLLTLALGAGQPVKLPARPRAGRRLRVGFINRHFGPQTETYTTLPMFEQLDPARFEVLLFTHSSNGTPLELHARNSAAAFKVLPEGLAAQVAELRAAELDVAVFGTNVTAVVNEVTQLAVHRVAPLQVVNNSSCTTTGLPEIDLYVSGTLTESAAAPAHFSERLGLLPGPAHAFNYTADQQSPATAWTRAALGIPDDALLFVSAANYFKVIPEMRTAWARLLAAVPGSRLLLHPFNPNWSSAYPVRRFCAEFDAVLAAHGVETDRLIVSTAKLPSRTDVRELLRVGDVYLDTFPFGGVNSLIDPLETGMPVVAWEGETFRSRMGAALLRTLGLDELVAADGEAYHALAVRLAADDSWRASLRRKIGERMARLPVFLDPLAASDAFGALLEKAHDEICANGLAAFRRAPGPLTGPEVAAPALRQAHGRHLMALGQSDRAAVYFLTAIQHDERNASLWHDLAVALQSSGRKNDSVSALQTCLSLDGRHVEGWTLLGELALAANHHDLLAEAVGMARKLAPGDDRVGHLLERAGLGSVPGCAPAPGPRILVYTDDPQHGGVAQYNHSLITGLVEAGYAVACAQSRSETPLVVQQRAMGVTHFWIPYDTKTEFARTMQDTIAARRILAAAQPDLIVFTDSCPLSNLAARDAAAELGLPHVVNVGFVGAYLADRFQASLGRLAGQYARANEVIAVSRENLDMLRQRFGLGAEAGLVVHNGRPARFFTPSNLAARARLRAELKLPDDAVLCLTIARLTAVKGYQYQLAAAQRLVRLPAGRHLHFVWIGDGELRPELERGIAAAGLGDRIHLTGHRWDGIDWYDAADIFVLPSELEGMPLAVMEAMARGLPVVATAVSGIPEELGDTGRLLCDPTANPAKTIAELIQVLAEWAKNPALRRTTGERGRARAEAMFREETMVRRTIELIARHLPGENTAALPAEAADLAQAV